MLFHLHEGLTSAVDSRRPDEGLLIAEHERWGDEVDLVLAAEPSCDPWVVVLVERQRRDRQPAYRSWLRRNATILLRRHEGVRSALFDQEFEARLGRHGPPLTPAVISSMVAHR